LYSQYKYRLETDKYDPAKPVYDAEGNIRNVPAKMRRTEIRQEFVDQCAAIYKFAISAEVTKGGALKMDKTAKLDIGVKAEKEQFISAVESHVKCKLHADIVSIGRGAPSVPKKDPAEAAAADMLKKNGGLKGLLGKVFGKRGKQMAAMAEMATDMVEEAGHAAQQAAKGGADQAKDEEKGDGEEVEHDDLVSPLKIEQYVACRVRPLAEFLEKRALTMSKRYVRLEFLVVIFNTLGAVLAVLVVPASCDTPSGFCPKYSDFISITVALSSLCLTLGDCASLHVDPPSAASW
jgi:hypothetical protein